MKKKKKKLFVCDSYVNNSQPDFALHRLYVKPQTNWLSLNITTKYAAIFTHVIMYNLTDLLLGWSTFWLCRLWLSENKIHIDSDVKNNDHDGSIILGILKKSYQEKHLKTKSNLRSWNSRAAYDAKSRKHQAES